VREHLYQRLVEQKPRRMTEEQANRWISEHYFDGERVEKSHLPIFRHIYDIAWQCMLTRSVDFLSGRNGPRKRDRNWIANLQCHADPGSGQLAIEVYEERLRTLDKLLRRKLDQLIDIFGQQCELEFGNPIYPLIGYLEGTRLAEKGGRSERMPRLIEALRPDEKPHVPDYYLIGRIAIVGSCDDDPSDKEGPH